MGLEEADLMLSVDAWRVCCRLHDAEMIPDFACIDSGGRLWNQLGPSHRLAIPVGCAIQGDFGPLCASRVCRVLVGGGEVDI